ncbi:hypothetical protein [Streptomyces chrestomyceticus]|uniref:Uncharacterized protein n=1 Tax=Streptomyces chrestomyceticus TaxID=68185 RepID=A0ABU7X1C6_9ACTN
MTMTSTMPTARKRRRKVRTKAVNHRPAIVASGLKVNEIDLTPGKEHVVCPDCSCWCPITGMLGTPKLVPHHVGRAGTTASRRCSAGSNRQVIIDIAVDAWRTKLTEAVPTTASRRATKVLPKPIPAPAAPVTRIHAGVPLEKTQRAYLAHIEECVRCGTGQHCTHGGVLAYRYVLVRDAEPARREARKQAAPAGRTAQWTKRGGETVETANNQCRPRLDGTVSEFCGPQVPLEPQDVEAYERRQAELAERYARRNSATSGA